MNHWVMAGVGSPAPILPRRVAVYDSPTAARLVRNLVGAACVVLAACGCSRYEVAIVCEDRINTYMLNDPDSSGRMLRVALVCLSQSNLEKLSRKGGFRGAGDWEEVSPETWINAKEWFHSGGEETVARVVSDAAMRTLRLAGGDRREERLMHFDPFGKRAGILALADFSGVEAEDKHAFESEAWILTRWKGHRLTLRVGETTIRWAEDD